MATKDPKGKKRQIRISNDKGNSRIEDVTVTRSVKKNRYTHQYFTDPKSKKEMMFLERNDVEVDSSGSED